MKNSLICGLVGALSLAAVPAIAQVESTDPIKLTLHDWTGQLLTTNIMGEVLKKAGYNIDYVQADYIAQFAGLKTGDLHVAMEIWETTGREAMDEATGTGNVENMGETGMQAIEEWWYPIYMKEKCPGLPDWEALNACAEVFATSETAALFAELESAYQREAPIVLWVYAPHWAPTKFNGEFVEFPAYSAECYSDPAWGSNPDMAYDCGKPRGPIWKVAWSGVKDKWPGAYDIIKSFKIDNTEMGDMVAKVDLEGEKLEDVVAAWMTTNEARWQEWVN